MALAYWILNDIKSLNKFIATMTLLLIFIIFDTWWQFFYWYDIFGFQKIQYGTIYRLTGPFMGNPHVGAWTAKLILIPSLFFIFYDKFKLKKNQDITTFFFLIICMSLFLTILISGERMSLILIFSSIFFIFLGMVLDKIFSLKKVFTILTLSISLILIFSYFFPKSTQYVIFSSIDKILNWRISDYGIVWQSAYDVWLQSPIFGAGLHKYREACENLGIYGSNYLEAISSGVCFHPHNISLQLLSETGIIGFILFYIMVSVLAFTSLKKYYTKKLWVSFALIFNIIFTCFLPIASSTSFFSNKYGAIVWLLVGIMLATNRLNAREN